MKPHRKVCDSAPPTENCQWLIVTKDNLTLVTPDRHKTAYEATRSLRLLMQDCMSWTPIERYPE